MADGLSGGGGSGSEGPGHLSLLLQELARAPGDDLHRAWQQRLQPGDAVGRFEILREVGRGGFGVVYEALDRELGRSVAFKTLRPARTGQELSAEWILKEAEAVARLDHPAIVTLHDVGRCESGPYLVEELLRGETLEQRLRGGPLTARDAVGVGLELARGLAHAHGRGVLHRDLKPGNVFLTEDGRVKLLDFGLAHLLGTRGLHGAGTPAYMAPEQLRGEAVDARADVFALGATLFEALAGKAPFEVKEGRSAALDEGPPPPLSEGAPAPLAEMIGRCLSRDAAKRPANGQAAVEELLAVQRALDRAGQEGRAAPAGAPARRTARLALGLAGIALVVAGGVYLATRGRATTESAAPGAASPVPSVAVLPFADMSPGKDQEYFADGIAEEILNALAQVQGLKVIGRTSSFSFKGRNEDLRTIGQKLDVGALLEGSVRKEGSRLRVTAQLVRTADGSHLWSQVFDREQAGVFAVQEEIAREVVRALEVKLLPGRGSGPRPATTSKAEVYDLVLRGRQLRKGSEDGCRGALVAFERAVALDPGYAPAWADLSEALRCRANDEQPYPGDPEFRRRALEAAERAIALAPELTEGYLARAMTRFWVLYDWEGGRSDVERALALSPGSAAAFGVRAYLLRVLGRLPEAVAAARRGTELDPLDGWAWTELGAARSSGGDLPQARRAFERALEVAPGAYYPAFLLDGVRLKDGEAAAALASASRSKVYWVRLSITAMAQHTLGNRKASQAALDELVAQNAAYQIAQVHAWRGERDRAFEWLDRAYLIRDSGTPEVKTDSLLSALHDDPRWKPFLRKMNLPVD